MSRIKTIETKDIAKTVNNGGCGECQTSCQSACKTSCGVANQQCEKAEYSCLFNMIVFRGKAKLFAFPRIPKTKEYLWYISIN